MPQSPATAGPHRSRGFAMRLPFVVLALLAATPAGALDLPARKAGLWDMKMTFEGRNLPAQAMQHCIDAETDKLMNSIGGNIVVDSVCKVGGATVTSHGVVSGDFNSAYTVKVTSTRDGAAAPGMPAGGTSNTTIEAKWTGACKPDQKPGDIIMAGGRKMNIS